MAGTSYNHRAVSRGWQIQAVLRRTPPSAPACIRFHRCISLPCSQLRGAPAQHRPTAWQLARKGSSLNTLECPGPPRSAPDHPEAGSAEQWGASPLRTAPQCGTPQFAAYPPPPPPLMWLPGSTGSVRHQPKILHISGSSVRWLQGSLTQEQRWLLACMVQQVAFHCMHPDVKLALCSSLGPLDGSVPGSAPRASGSPFPETPLTAPPPTWEDLHMIQTRAMLELRVWRFTSQRPVAPCHHCTGPLHGLQDAPCKSHFYFRQLPSWARK